MGAVRKLATVVIVGLVALSTLMVVYLAAEPTRRDSATTEQQAVSIERGTSLYITYCLQCHGPAGLGSAERDADGEPMGRTGAVLNQNAVFSQEQLESARAIYQSDDPVQQGIAEDWIRYRILYGVPAEQMTANFTGTVVMPSFQNDLNVQQIEDLVYLLMYGDWNYVYNSAVHYTGVAVAEEECLENPDGPHCDDTSHAPPVYPTVPPDPEEIDTADEAADLADAATPETAPEQDVDPAADAAAPAGDSIEIEAMDNVFSETELTLRPGDTITMTNTGFLEHDFTVDELGIHEVTPSNGDTVTITIPDDAEPGEYEFYCSVPGHREQGMLGTLIIEAP